MTSPLIIPEKKTLTITSESDITKFDQTQFENAIKMYNQPSVKGFGSREEYLELFSNLRMKFDNHVRVRPLSVDTLVGYLANTRGAPTEEEISICRDFIHKLRMMDYENVRMAPTEASARILIGRKPEFKMIWSYPLKMRLLETMFAEPLLRQFKEGGMNPYALWVFKNFPENLRQISRLRRDSKSVWLCIEWEPFDHCTPAWLIHDCFRILNNYFEYDEIASPDGDEEMLFQNLWNHLVHYFIHTYIRFPAGNLFVKKQGIPQGSLFANIIQSMANCFCTEFCLTKMSVEYSESSRWYYGNQALVLVHEKFNMDTFASTAHKFFGFKLNRKYSTFESIPKFLGYKIPTHGPVTPIDGHKIVDHLQLPHLIAPKTDDLIKAIEVQLTSLGVDLREESSGQKKMPEKLQMEDLEPTRDICEWYFAKS